MKSKRNFSNIFRIGIFVLLAILVVNTFFIFSIGSGLDKKIEEAKELARPAKIEIIKLESSCTDCFDTDEILNVLRDSDIEITDEKSLARKSAESEDMINKYGITQLPSIVLLGEIDKTSIQNFKEVDGALVFDAITPPFEDVKNEEEIGKVVSIIISDKNCEDCIDYNPIILNLEQSGVYIDEVNEYDLSSSDAKKLISENEIEKVPVLLLSKDIEAYPEIAQGLSQAGEESDDYYVLESQAPYVEVDTNKIRGLVKLTYINDSSCEDCYDVTIHKPILARFGLAFEEEIYVDYSDKTGKDIVTKYDIPSLPTVIITGDVNVYENLVRVWEQVGTVDDDGTFVFKELSVLGQNIVFKNVTKT